jgi:glycosyltransferase involved in cell wall biosynthesis
MDKIQGGLRCAGQYKQSLAGSPLVSIITVVFNGAAHLEQAIRSVLDQNYDNIEYSVIDGGSSDGTLDIIKKYEEKIDLWISEPDNGVYDAMNKGIELARGDLIGLLNADDFYEQDAIRAVVDRYLKCGLSQGIFYGHNYVLQEDLGIRYVSHASFRFWRGMPICHQAMFVHRECYRKIGGFDQRLQLTADFDFLVRAVKQGVPFIPVDRVLVTFRASGLSVTNPLPLIRENRLVITKYFGILSAVFFKFAVRSLWDIIMLELKNGILRLFGGKTVLRLRKLYTHLFLSRGREV